MSAARSRALIGCDLWAPGSEFLTLTTGEQRLSLYLASQPDLNAAGILPLRVRRWSTAAATLTPEGVARDLRGLEDGGFVVADAEWQEVFVATWFDSEGIGSQPRRVTAALDAIGACRSPALRAAASEALTAAVMASPARPPRGVRALVLRRDGYRCLRCGWAPGDSVPFLNGRPLYRGLEIDHIHPKSLGGPDSMDNFQTLCTSCNASKGARV
jgi:hypothetical protein